MPLIVNLKFAVARIGNRAIGADGRGRLGSGRYRLLNRRRLLRRQLPGRRALRLFTPIP